MSRSTSWFLLVCCLAGLLLARESRQPGGALAGVDRAFFDWLVVNARPGPSQPGAVPVTLVEIDDSVADTPGRLPLSALDYSTFLRALRRYDPAVVAIEPVLDFSQASAGTEQILLDEALGIPKLLLAVELGDSAGNGLDAASLPALANGVAGGAGGLPGFPEIVAAPNVRLMSLATASGATNLPRASAGPVRDVPLLFRCRGRVLPSFMLQVLTLTLRLAPAEITAAPGGEIRLGDRLRLPISRAGRALLDAREFGRVRRLSLDDLPLLETGQAPPGLRAQAESLRGGVVILGRTDRAARSLRLPDGRAVSPAEVFAWASASLQHAPAARRAPEWADAIAAAWIVAASLAGRHRGRRAAGVAALVALAGYGLGALSMFEWQRLWLPLALPAGLALLAAALAWLLPEPGAGPQAI